MPNRVDRFTWYESDIVVKGTKRSTKELALQTLTKDFSCCPSHAAQEFPGLIDNLKELGYISPEESYAAEALLPEHVFEIATGLKETKQGDDLLIHFTRGLRRQLGLREISFGLKQHRGLDTINAKISKLPRSQAAQVRKASSDLQAAMGSEERQQAIKDIPDAVWEEAQRQDLLDDQPEEVVVAS